MTLRLIALPTLAIYVRSMDKRFVIVWDCSLARRAFSARVELVWMLSYAGEHLPAHQYEQFVNDLTVLGRARIDGFGGWFEYEMANDSTDQQGKHRKGEA